MAASKRSQAASKRSKAASKRSKAASSQNKCIDVFMYLCIYVVVCVFNLVWMNLVHPWIFDFFWIIFASLIEENSLNIGRMRLRFCPKMENGCTYLNFFRALFTKRIGSYDHFRFFRENLIIWESTQFRVICRRTREENPKFQFPRDFFAVELKFSRVMLD